MPKETEYSAFCRKLGILIQIQHSDLPQLLPIQLFSIGACGAISSCMLRIDKDSAGLVTVLRLSGRIQRGDLDSIRSAMDDIRTRKMLDLTDVTLVDVAVVQFLIC